MLALAKGPSIAGVAFYGAPLCPAGYHPHLGGDQQLRRVTPSRNAEDWRKQKGQPISPLVGEMSGKAEGGAKDRKLPPLAGLTPP